MALPPNIPTSFVPKTASAGSLGSTSNFMGAFGFVAYFVFGLSLLTGLGVFGYSKLLAYQQTSKEKQLAAAEAALDPETARGFVRLRDRLIAGANLLGAHTALSNYFTLVESLSPQTVRFDSMHLMFSNTGQITLTAGGIAKSFNALAAVSNAFAENGKIKDAIFSNISVTSSGAVTFSLTGTVDPRLVAFIAPAATAQPAVPETTTASTTTP